MVPACWRGPNDRFNSDASIVQCHDGIIINLINLFYVFDSCKIKQIHLVRDNCIMTLDSNQNLKFILAIAYCMFGFWWYLVQGHTISHNMLTCHTHQLWATFFWIMQICETIISKLCNIYDYYKCPHLQLTFLFMYQIWSCDSMFLWIIDTWIK